MPSIKELVDKHSKVPGDIKVRRPDWAPGEWFQPFFSIGDRAWRGKAWNGSDALELSYSDMKLYEEPKPKVKRAQYVIIPDLIMEVRRLRTELERIGWHELTWQEARDVARKALECPPSKS